MAGVYIHIPFCNKQCSYCDFHSSVSFKDRDRMVNAIVKEITIRSGFFANQEIKTIYLGGGTPSVLSIEQIDRIVKELGKYTNLSNIEEFTFEANPEDITKEYLESLLKIGINRLSLGVQSFDEDILRLFNRRHSASKAKEVVKMAKDVGFDNITIDLIYGVGGFDISTWKNSITEAINLGVQHISAYHLTIEDKTILGHKMAKGEYIQIEDSQSKEQFDLLHNMMENNGFEHYEVSNYAKQCRRAVHNSNYWSGVEYIGFGPSAHSFYNGKRYWHLSNNSKYIESIEANRLAIEEEKLTQKDRYNEYIMLSLRRVEGVELKYIRDNFSAEYVAYFINKATELANKGVLKRYSGRYYINSSDFLVSDMIIVELFKD